MQRIAIALAGATTVLLVAAMSAQGNSPKELRPCATIDGPAWTQTINVTSFQKPPKKPDLRVIKGTRYYVFVDHVGCATATRYTADLLRHARPHWQTFAGGPAGFTCHGGPTAWFRDAFNGDAVRSSSPPDATGLCTTQLTDPVPGKTYRTFVWSPAKPCRPAGFVTPSCRKH